MTATTDPRNGAVPTWAALAAVAVAMGATAWSGKRFSPTPDHPRTAWWYARLDKPGFTPPGPAFGAGWGLIQLALSYGGFRLMRSRRTPDRDAAIGLWALNNALIAGWSGLFFGSRALGSSALASAGMIAAACGYGVVATRTDKTAAATAIPLIAWLGFATVLAEEVWRRND